MYDKICVETFLKNQLQLFPEEVAFDEDEANDFLEDLMAVVCDNTKEVFDYLEEEMDVYDLTEDDLFDTPEIFPLPDGRFLIVEG